MAVIQSVLIVIVSTLAFSWSAPTNLEKVWLKDVTTNSQRTKRSLGDLDLPNELTFHLSRSSDDLTLNLKRNHNIDANVGVYFARKLKNGRSVLEKIRDSEQEYVAYYQDMNNGAFITVRCAQRSNERCHRVINGNIRIGGRTYSIQPEETDLTPAQFMDVPGLLGRRYVLQDQEHIEKETSMKNKVILRKQPKREYNINVAVLIDSSIWDLYGSTKGFTNPLTKNQQVNARIRQAYSHVFNGVSLVYNGLHDASISVNITLCAFIFFKRQSDFPHALSNVMIVNGKQYIEATHYLHDLLSWDHDISEKEPQTFDHAMLFTRYDLYKSDPTNNAIRGISFTGGVCETGSRTSVVEAGDFDRMIRTASHELGHSLGSWNDGEIGSQGCDAKDEFIMSHNERPLSPTMQYNANNYMFSSCSVEAIKETLSNKQCVTDPGIVYNEQEYKNFLKKQPGEVYSLDDQCHLIKGRSSVCCKTAPANACHFMKCTDPKTGDCMSEYYNVAMGTECGHTRDTYQSSSYPVGDKFVVTCKQPKSAFQMKTIS